MEMTMMKDSRKMALEAAVRATGKLAQVVQEVATQGGAESLLASVRFDLRMVEKGCGMMEDPLGSRLVQALVVLVEDKDVRAVLEKKAHLGSEVRAALEAWHGVEEG